MMARGGFWFLMIGVLLAPVFAPLTVALQSPGAATAWLEWRRIAPLLGNTIGLAAIAIVVAVPFGTLAGILLARFRVPFASFIESSFLLLVFIPLPILAIAWQVILSRFLPPLVLEPGMVAWRPWSQGLLPAGFVHGMVALPVVALIVRFGLQYTNQSLEDLATLQDSRQQWWRRVLIPQLRRPLLVAVAFVVVQTFTEIPITDSMMVRTYAEEVYTQLIVGPDRVPETVASTFPGVLLVVCMMAYLQRTWVGLQPDTTATDTPLLRRGRPARIVFFLGILTLIVVVLPLVAITVPLRWWRDPGTAQRILTDALIAHGSPLISSLLAAVATGVLTTALAILAVYRTRPHRIDRRILELFAMLIWAMPGPLVGLGLKTIILWLVRLNDAVPALPFAALLYDQP
ncbi:MAG: hypothetical protein ACRCZF_08680, partial [Gemmataceae bacterium]